MFDITHKIQLVCGLLYKAGIFTSCSTDGRMTGKQ